MFAFDIHGREPSVERLVVHLPNMNRIIYHENTDLGNIVSDMKRYCTMLTEWFVANRKYASAHHLTYDKFPSEWTWDAKNKVWLKRQRKSRFGSPIGRIYHVHPSTGELFFLRILLTKVAGAKSFVHLRTYEGRRFDTFKEACQARGLVGDDKNGLCSSMRLLDGLHHISFVTFL